MNATGFTVVLGVPLATSLAAGQTRTPPRDQAPDAKRGPGVIRRRVLAADVRQPLRRLPTPPR